MIDKPEDNPPGDELRPLKISKPLDITKELAANPPPVPTKPPEATPPPEVTPSPELRLEAEPLQEITEAPLPAPLSSPDGEEEKAPPKRKTLSIIIHDPGVLRAAYMQFIKGGGLFIPTKKAFAMGEDTNLVIRLLDEEDAYRVTAKVVWITPLNSPSNRAAGIGVEFAEDKNGERLRNRIELILGPHLKSTESTHTM